MGWTPIGVQCLWVGYPTTTMGVCWCRIPLGMIVNNIDGLNIYQCPMPLGVINNNHDGLNVCWCSMSWGFHHHQTKSNLKKNVATDMMNILRHIWICCADNSFWSLADSHVEIETLMHILFYGPNSQLTHHTWKGSNSEACASSYIWVWNMNWKPSSMFKLTTNWTTHKRMILCVVVWFINGSRMTQLRVPYLNWKSVEWKVAKNESRNNWSM